MSEVLWPWKEQCNATRQVNGDCEQHNSLYQLRLRLCTRVNTRTKQDSGGQTVWVSELSGGGGHPVLKKATFGFTLFVWQRLILKDSFLSIKESAHLNSQCLRRKHSLNFLHCHHRSHWCQHMVYIEFYTSLNHWTRQIQLPAKLNSKEEDHPKCQ